MSEGPEPIAIVAPTLSRAQTAAALLARRGRPGAVPFSLAGYLASVRAPGRVVLCPAGRSVVGDIAFLRRVRERILWKAPTEVLYEAIAGMLGSPETPIPPDPSRASSTAKARRGIDTALLLEGTVDSRRARALLTGDTRLWIVENARKVRVDSRLMERLRARGVRWFTLEPVTVVGVLASADFAGERRRWRKLLPPRTPVWRRED